MSWMSSAATVRSDVGPRSRCSCPSVAVMECEQELTCGRTSERSQPNGGSLRVMSTDRRAVGPNVPCCPSRTGVSSSADCAACTGLGPPATVATGWSTMVRCNVQRNGACSPGPARCCGSPHKTLRRASTPCFWNLASPLTLLMCVVLSLAALPVQCAPQDKSKITRVSFNIQEELDANTLIGNIVTEARLNRKYSASILDQLRFSFLTQLDFNKTYFAIEENSGILRTTERIDRDAICPQQPRCLAKFDVAVQPIQYFKIIKVTVEIFDINDNKPTFPEQRVSFEISESTLVGTSFALPAAHDPDSGLNKIQGYELDAHTSSFELRESHTADGATDLRLVLQQKLDREDRGYYDLWVTARDAGEPAESGTLQVQITVLDANDNNPVFDDSTYEINVIENIPVGSTVTRVRATDPDEGLNGDVYYQFEKHTEQEFGDIFEIDRESGDITVKGVLDYETSIIYLLSVSAHDKGPDSLPSHTTVVVRVQDSNDNVPEMDVNTLTAHGDAEVMENSKPGTFVAYISVMDADSGDNGKVTCSLNDNVNFALEKRYLTEFKVVTKRTFNRESREHYEFTIVCKDHGTEVIQKKFVNIKVNIQDENDHTPHFTSKRYSAIIEESNMVGAMLMRVSAMDEDTGPNAEITYEMAPGGHGVFQLDPKTGVVKAAIVFDYEAAQKHETRIIATDSGNPPRSATATIQVKVLDIDDERPEFSKKTFSFGIYENMPKGSSVGDVLAVDADAPPNNKFHYYLDPSRSPMDTFSIDSDTGRISTQRKLDRERQSEYYLTVVALPQDWPMYSSTASVTVYVVDQNDNPPVFEFPTPANNTRSVASNTALGSVVTRLKARDKDGHGVNGDLVYSIISGNVGNAFTVDPSTGAISVRAKLHEFEGESFRLKVRVMDKCQTTCDALAAYSELVIKIGQAATFPKASAQSVLAEENLTIILAFALAAIIVIILVVIAIIIIIRRRNRENSARNSPAKEKMLKQGKDKKTSNHSRYISSEEMQRLRSPKKERDGTTSADSTLSRTQEQFTHLPPPPSSWILTEGQDTQPRNGGHAPNGDVPHGNSWQNGSPAEGSLPVPVRATASMEAALPAAAASSQETVEEGSVGSVSNSDSGRGHSEDGDPGGRGEELGSIPPPRGPAFKHWNVKKQKPLAPMRRLDPSGMPAAPAPSPVHGPGRPLLPPATNTVPPPAMQNDSITRTADARLAKLRSGPKTARPPAGIVGKSSLRPSRRGSSDNRVRFAPCPVQPSCHDDTFDSSLMESNSDTESAASAESGEYTVYETVDDAHSTSV